MKSRLVVMGRKATGVAYTLAAVALILSGIWGQTAAAVAIAAFLIMREIRALRPRAVDYVVQTNGITTWSNR